MMANATQTPFVRVASVFLAAALVHLPVLAAGESLDKKVIAPTFTRDVAPILQKSCQSCHRPESIAPMSLLTYQDARPWAASIKRRVAAREMPPWFIDRNVGISKYKNDISLSDEEIATIVTWADTGAPMGDPADMPSPVKFPDPTAWQIGKPDLVVEMTKPILMKAAAPDWWVDGFSDGVAVTEDRWVKAVEIKPVSGYRAVHHSGAAQILDEGSDAAAQGAESMLGMYVVGKNGDVSPDGVGRLLKANSKIRFNMHLHAYGEDVEVRMAVGFQFYPKGYVPKYALHTDVWGGDFEREFELPAGASNVRSDAYTILTKPAVITQFEPHMHNRGKAMCLELIYPPETVPGQTSQLRRHPKSTYSKWAADTEVVSCVDRFNFGWLRAYSFEDDVAPVVPAGTILHFMMWHDNSTANKQNYDSTNWIGWGQRSMDEMNHAWMGYYFISEEDYKQRLAAKYKDKGPSAQPGRAVD